jgi:hypothetical protein
MLVTSIAQHRREPQAMRDTSTQSVGWLIGV